MKQVADAKQNAPLRLSPNFTFMRNSATRKIKFIAIGFLLMVVTVHIKVKYM